MENIISCYDKVLLLNTKLLYFLVCVTFFTQNRDYLCINFRQIVTKIFEQLEINKTTMEPEINIFFLAHPHNVEKLYIKYSLHCHHTL